MRIAIILFILSILSFDAYAHKKKVVKKVYTPSSYLVAEEDGTILYHKNIDEVRSIASITKLLVSMLAADQDLEEMLQVPDKRTVSTVIPKNTTHLSRKDLLILTLVKSDNFASQILCDNIEHCIVKMNELAYNLGMKSTVVHEPSGLDRRNVSTANDLMKLVIASSKNKTISELSKMPTATIAFNNSELIIRNTNPLTNTFNVTVSKTGFTNPAGGCLVMAVNNGLKNTIYVLLGSRNTKTRIVEMKQLMKKHEAI